MSKSGFLITQIKQRQDRIFSKLLDQMGLPMNGPQGRILYVLWKEDNLSMSELSHRTSLANNTLTNMIKRMVTMGMVERYENPKNRRQVFIRLTKSTRMLKEKMETVSQQMNVLFYKGMTEREIDELDSYLEKILKNLTQIEEETI